MMAPYDAGCAVRSSVRSSSSVLSSRPRSVVESSEDIRRREAETARPKTDDGERRPAPSGAQDGGESHAGGNRGWFREMVEGRCVEGRRCVARASRSSRQSRRGAEARSVSRHLSNHPLTGCG